MCANIKSDFDDILKEVARRISKVEDIDNLGKALGFIPAEIARYKQTNTRYHYDSDCSGTLSMLRKWNEGQSETEHQEKLIQALLRANLHTIVDELFSNTSINSDVELPVADFGNILKEVARRISEVEDIDNLGKALGFIPAEIARYKQTNTRHYDIDFSGTLEMLRKWHEGQSETEQQEKLIQALRRANLHTIVDELFPNTSIKSDFKSESQPKSQPKQEANKDEITPSRVTDAHIKNLSELLLPSHYYNLSASLEIKYNIADGIERREMRSYPEMYIRLLQLWKAESNKTLSQLDQALKESGAGGLISKYKQKNVR